MEHWEQEIVTIQREQLKAQRLVILIEPHPLTRDMLSLAIHLLGEHYWPLNMTFEEAEIWLQEMEPKQAHPSVVLFDCPKEVDALEHFLGSLRVYRANQQGRPKALGMTGWVPSFLNYQLETDVMLWKPFSIKDLHHHLLNV